MIILQQGIMKKTETFWSLQRDDYLETKPFFFMKKKEGSKNELKRMKEEEIEKGGRRSG